MSKLKTFRDLHHGKELFVLPNAWDAESALGLEKAGFAAVATSSSAVASSLGYADGEKMPFDHYYFMIQRIAATINLPFTVDMEMGYGKTPKLIFANLCRLMDAGVVGINLEDSIIEGGKRVLQDASAFARKLETIKGLLKKSNQDIFINLRCDTYLLNTPNKQTETSTRARLYESSGADSLFLPCIVNNDDIRAAAQSTKLPLAVMTYPGLSDFHTLSSLGVKRLSFGGSLFDKLYNQIKGISHNILKNKTISVLVE